MLLFIHFFITIGFGCYDEYIGPVIAIDIGTTFSRVGIFQNCKVDIIKNKFGKSITPSIISFTDEQILVGDLAKEQMISNQKNTICAIKRLIGRQFNDPEVQKELKHLSYKVINRNERPYIEIELKDEIRIISPEKIYSMILLKMKKWSEDYIKNTIKHAIVTVPVYFNDAQRKAIKDIGAYAGLDIIRILNEPFAAVYAYGLERINCQRILVFDLGSSTFDVSLLLIDDYEIKILATAGDSHLGGIDFDNKVVDYFLYLFKHRTGKDASTDSKAVAKLKCEVEKAKHDLSNVNQTYIEIKNFFEGEDLSELFTRSRFEELNMDLFCKVMISVEQIFKNTNISKNEVDEIILVGGSAKIPKIQQLVSDFFNGKSMLKSINTDEVNVYGAALEGSLFSDGPDSVDISFIYFIDYSLGIETNGGVMKVLIPRLTLCPVKKTQTFVTSQDDQDYFHVRIFKGENIMTKDNTFLGEFNLTGLPPGPKGTVHIQVTMEIDLIKDLKVTAENNKNKESIIISENKKKKRMFEIIDEAVQA